ncbi:MAG: DUF3604 domain-containing protein [Spirochaetia bacterium]
MRKINPGTASVTPRDPVIAGSYVTLQYTYTAGHPVDDSGYIKIAFRFAGDFGTFQFTDPEKPNYCTLRTDGDCKLIPRWDSKGNIRPWGTACYIKITGGFLNTGEKIYLTIGDTAGGSPGWQIQTFVEHTFEFKTYADPIATYQFKEIDESPVLSIIPGKPEKPVLTAPSEAETDKPFTYFLKREDRWGNPSGKAQKLSHKGFTGEGIERIIYDDPETGRQAVSNPVRVVSKFPKERLFWADFHGQSEETIGTNSIEDYFSFGRDKALLDICAHQGNDFQITDEFWEKINSVTDDFYSPGSFVTFPGYEWSGNTPLGGDRNIYYKESGGIISRSCRDLLPGEESVYPDSPDARSLFKNLKGPAPFAFAHVGGRYADASIHDEDIEIAMEIHSAWGTFEWLLDDAFSRGYRIGICANSDDHKGRPGASYPGNKKFGSYGGLTCVLSGELTRESVYRALQERKFYATTGSRIILDVTAELASGDILSMGDERENESPVTLNIKTAGTAPIEYIQIKNGADVIETVYPVPREQYGKKRIKVMWGGAEVKGRARMVEWDGSLEIERNRITDIAGINFWNPERRLRIQNDSSASWQSITTGSDAGIALTLENKNEGTIRINTKQKSVWVPVKEIEREPVVWECGGLRKELRIYSLPDTEPSSIQEYSVTLDDLKKPFNPVYVKIVQEDGHKAWSTPIFIRK